MNGHRVPKSENAVFKYRPFAHLNILVLASWLSGTGGCLDTRGWQFDSWQGVLLRATFCSGALLRQPSHRVVSDPFSCQIQNSLGDAEMKKAKRLLLLRRVSDRVYIFEWLVRLHVCWVRLEDARAESRHRPVISGGDPWLKRPWKISPRGSSGWSGPTLQEQEAHDYFWTAEAVDLNCISSWWISQVVRMV